MRLQLSDHRRPADTTLLEMDWMGEDDWAVTRRMPIGYARPSC